MTSASAQRKAWLPGQLQAGLALLGLLGLTPYADSVFLHRALNTFVPVQAQWVPLPLWLSISTWGHSEAPQCKRQWLLSCGGRAGIWPHYFLSPIRPSPASWQEGRPPAGHTHSGKVKFPVSPRSATRAAQPSPSLPSAQPQQGSERPLSSARPRPPRASLLRLKKQPATWGLGEAETPTWGAQKGGSCAWVCSSVSTARLRAWPAPLQVIVQ